MPRPWLRLWVALTVACGLAPWFTATAQEKPAFPLMQALPLPDHEVSFQWVGNELCRLHFSPDQSRPFVYPVNGQAGRSLTRMGHPRDPESHSHHNSVWISHQDVDGVNFWEDRGKGRILHRRVLRFEDGAKSAGVLTENAWVADTNDVLLVERRLTSVQHLGERGWLLLIDLELQPAGSAVTLGKTPFGLIGVRMAKTIGVNDGGGSILNSDGERDEAGTFRKPARWVDYSGCSTERTIEGIALFDHPANHGHPAVFHTRNDGWMGACLTYNAPLAIEPGRKLRLRYGLLVHPGAGDAKRLQTDWERFAAMPIPSLAVNR